MSEFNESDTTPEPIVGDYWVYFEKIIDPKLAQPLYDEMKKLCQYYDVTAFGKIYQSKRRSAVFIRDNNITRTTDSPYFNYGQMPNYYDTISPVLQKLWNNLHSVNNVRYQYALVHIYESGEHTIGWHNDKEAINPPSHIFSVSLGAVRKFRFRDIKATSGWCQEFSMPSGSALHMLPGCQSKYKHTVPVEKKVKEWRINITFRQSTEIL